MALFQSAVAEAEAALAAGRPPPSPRGRVWLYSLVPADYDGAGMLPHWVDHYVKLGIPTSRMHLLVNHNPRRSSPEGLEAVTAALERLGVPHSVWLGQYSSEAHLARKLGILNDVATEEDDWIVLADSDELQDYGPLPAPAFLAAVERAGGTFVRGEMVDRLAADGSVPPLRADESIERQFPLACLVVGPLYGGKTRKVAAFKAFLRSNQGNHKVVLPEAAREYFGPGEPGRASPRGGFYGGEDLFPLTPYARRPERYAPEGPLRAVPAPVALRVWHFKWHAAVLRNLADRLAHYKGAVDRGGLPRYKHYREAERVLDALAAGGQRLDVPSFGCVRPEAVGRDEHLVAKLREKRKQAEAMRRKRSKHARRTL